MTGDSTDQADQEALNLAYIERWADELDVLGLWRALLDEFGPVG